MKLILVWLMALALLPYQGAEAQIYVANFSESPPYTLNETVIGKDRWIKRDIPSGEDLDAAIILDAGGQQRLRLRSSETDPGRARASVGVNFDEGEFSDRYIQAKVSIAWTGVFTSGSSGVSFGSGNSTLQTSNVPALISLDNTAGGGVFVQYGVGTYSAAGTKRELLLSGASVKPGYFYDFELIFDLVSKTVDVNMKGLDVNDQAIDITAAGLSFADLTSFTEIRAITAMVSRGERREVWVSSFELAAIPEPSAAALAVIGVTALVWGVRSRRRH